MLVRFKRHTEEEKRNGTKEKVKTNGFNIHNGQRSFRQISGCSQENNKRNIAAFLETIEKNLAAGNKVRIDKLGILNVKDRAARKGRNPQTGEEIQIPASKKIAFRVSLSLKTAAGIATKR